MSLASQISKNYGISIAAAKLAARLITHKGYTFQAALFAATGQTY